VAGSVKVRLGTTDFSAFLLQAQASGAKILAINVAGDNATAMKQADEFGLAAQGFNAAEHDLVTNDRNGDARGLGVELALIAYGKAALHGLLDHAREVGLLQKRPILDLVDPPQMPRDHIPLRRAACRKIGAAGRSVARRSAQDG
jgi:hypothetical protein